MKPAIVFDLGKVLVDFDYSIAARKIAARSSKAPEDLHAFLGSLPVLVKFERGQLSRQEFFGEIKNLTGFRGELAEFGNHFADIFSAIPPYSESWARRSFRACSTTNNPMTFCGCGPSGAPPERRPTHWL